MFSFSQGYNIGKGHIVLRRRPSDQSVRDQGAMLSPSEFFFITIRIPYLHVRRAGGECLRLESFLSAVGSSVLTRCLPTCRTISFDW